jgi:hypothetical protein
VIQFRRCGDVVKYLVVEKGSFNASASANAGTRCVQDCQVGFTGRDVVRDAERGSPRSQVADVEQSVRLDIVLAMASSNSAVATFRYRRKYNRSSSFYSSCLCNTEQASP